MSTFAAADDGVDWAGFDAQGAADAVFGVDAGNVAFCGAAAAGVDGFFGALKQLRKGGDGLGASRWAAV